MESTAEAPVQPNWLQDTLKNGLILGATHIVIFLTLYYTAPEFLAGFSYLFFIMFLNFGFVIYMGIQWRDELGGFMSYGTAFKHAFMILLFNGLLNTIFLMGFIFIEPGLPQVMADAQLESSLYWAEKFGAPEASIDEMRDKFNPEDVTKRFTLVGQLTGIGFAAIFYAIGASIMALFTRKNVPMDM
jgi:Protein of unknown function (DUF4199)